MSRITGTGLLGNLFLRCLVLVSTGWLVCLVYPASAQSQRPLPPDRVFSFSVERASSNDVRLTWRIAPDTYLYRDKFEVRDEHGRSVRPVLPAGETKDDPTFGVTVIFRGRVQLLISAEELGARRSLKVTYQGCAERGICYPPIEKQVDLATLVVGDVKPRDFSNVAPPSVSTRTTSPTPIPVARAARDETSMLAGAMMPMLAAFYGLGLLLAFTPCVFPMIPILSGILVRSGGSSVKRGVALSGTYVLSMAAAYASLGLAAAWSGQNLQVVLQTPAAIVAISAAFVVLALSMFGVFELQLPARAIPQSFRQGGSLSASLAGSALLGFGAALIVGPCVTPPLAAALLYVAQTGEIGRGAAALFALGLGMGTPLLAFGVFGPRALPRSGAWLVRIKHVFGFVFLALAIWTTSRIVPILLTWAASSLWIVALIVYLAAGTAAWPITSVRTRAFALIALLVAVGLPGLVLPNMNEAVGPAFGSPTETTVRTSAALDSAVAAARSSGRSMFVSFSADWCVECKLLDRNVFAAQSVRQRMQDFQVIHADVTAPSGESMALMKRFDVVGPPTMFFLDGKTGEEIPGSRSIGSIGAEAFIARIPKGRS
jgi:thiol:disulfide interchange protein DsbD